MAEDADLWYRIYDRVVFHNLEDPLLIYTVKKRLSLKQAMTNIKVKISNLKRRNKIMHYVPYLFRDSIYGLKRMAGL